MKTSLSKAKIIATSIHLSISLLVFILLTAFIVYVWYPGPYFAYAGGWQGIRFVAGACLVLGPLLTLIIFNPAKSKREKMLDYSVIISIQIAALAWGVYASHSQRPVAIVYHDGSFEAVVQESFAAQTSMFDFDTLNDKSEQHPPLLFVRKPKAEEIPVITSWAIIKGTPEYYLAFLYDGVSKHIPELTLESKLNFEKMQDNPLGQKKLNSFLKANKLTAEQTLLLRFQGRYGNAWLILSKKGELLGTI